MLHRRAPTGATTRSLLQTTTTVGETFEHASIAVLFGRRRETLRLQVRVPTRFIVDLDDIEPLMQYRRIAPEAGAR